MYVYIYIYIIYIYNMNTCIYTERVETFSRGGCKERSSQDRHRTGFNSIYIYIHIYIYTPGQPEVFIYIYIYIYIFIEREREREREIMYIYVCVSIYLYLSLSLSIYVYIYVLKSSLVLKSSPFLDAGVSWVRYDCCSPLLCWNAQIEVGNCAYQVFS